MSESSEHSMGEQSPYQPQAALPKERSFWANLVLSVFMAIALMAGGLVLLAGTCFACVAFG